MPEIRAADSVSIFIRFHAITFQSREVSAIQTGAKIEFDAK